jgi:hypothetical protein
MATLAEIRPKALRRIIDCAQDAGIDVSDWKRAANPARCYAWSFYAGRTTAFSSSVTLDIAAKIAAWFVSAVS